MNGKIRKWMSAVISAAMVVTSISTVAFAADTTQKVIIDDNFNSVSLDGNKSGMNGAWKNINGWWNMEPEKRDNDDVCWKWTGTGNNLGSYEQIYVEMDALKAGDTLNISYDLKLHDNWNTKSIVVLDGGTDNVEFIQLGEAGSGGVCHIGTNNSVGQSTNVGVDFARNEWVKVNITVNDGKTSIKVGETELCKDIMPPAGQTFNQAGVNKVRFMADGVYNDENKNVYIDNVKITVDSDNGGSETPDEPETPLKSVLLSENFENYEKGQTVRNTIMKNDSNWSASYSEDESTIVGGAGDHGNALSVINPGWSGGTKLTYTNMNFDKKYATIETMFKGVDGNFEFYIWANGKDKSAIHIENGGISGGERLADNWYKYYAVIDRDKKSMVWAIKDMDDKVIVLNTINLGEFANFDGFNFTNWSTTSPLLIDEISIKQSDDKPEIPKAPLKTTLFEEKFDEYESGQLFRNVKNDNNWRIFYSDNSLITEDSGRGKVLQMIANSDWTGDVNLAYEGITPELNVVDFSIMFKTPEATTFEIYVYDGSSYGKILVVTDCKLGNTEITPNTWYEFNAEINRNKKDNNCNWKIVTLDNKEVYIGKTTVNDFCGFKVQEWMYNGKYQDILFDEIKVTQRCGTPSLTADGLAFYIGDEKQKDPNAISTATDKITLTFNTVMNLGSLKENVKIKTDNKEVSYIAELDDNNVFTIKLSEPLKPNTNYTIEIGGGVKAYTGETIEKALTEKFKTTAGEMTGKITGVKIDTTPVTQPSQLTSGAKMNITIDYRNALENTALNGYVIVAYFNGNKLIKADYGEKIERAASVNSDTISCTRTVPDFGTETPTSAKIMFWNGLDKMIPITDAYVIE